MISIAGYYSGKLSFFVVSLQVTKFPPINFSTHVNARCYTRETPVGATLCYLHHGDGALDPQGPLSQTIPCCDPQGEQQSQEGGDMDDKKVRPISHVYHQGFIQDFFWGGGSFPRSVLHSPPS